MSATAPGQLGAILSERRSAPATARMPVSVLIPVRNEAVNLPRCLDAIRDWADEIVVVDSGSTDETVAIAKDAGATVLQFSYRGGWPKKRQWALDSHDWKNNWTLLLDADEILTSPVKTEISEAIASGRSDGYWLPFRIVFLGRMLRFGDTQLWKCSLFRSGKGRYERRLGNQNETMSDIEVHEHVVVDGPTSRLTCPVRHENWNSLARYVEKHNTYSTWEAAVLREGSDADLPASPFGNQAQRRRWLKRTLIRLPGSPLLRFLYIYFLRLGFLDGRPGLIYATFKMVQMLHVKAKMYELDHSQQGRCSEVSSNSDCHEQPPSV